MLLLKGIIAICLSRINEERTINSIYHLLTGKKSIQTVQDAHLYRTGHAYGIYKNLKFEDFNQVIYDLIHKNYMTQTDSDNIFVLTKKGDKWIEEHHFIPSFLNFQGIKYHSIDIIFYKRLLLFIQVLTNRQMNNSSYIPIIDKISVTQWMKTIYKSFKYSTHTSLKAIYEELYILLSNLKAQEAELFVDRLTGYENYGKSIHQLAHTYQLTVHEVELTFIKIIHQMLDQIIRESHSFQMMNFIIKDLSQESFITKSATKTFHLLKEGYSIDEIINIRNLKRNTIYDHIIEISIFYTDFPIHMYVSENQQNEIINAIRLTNSAKLKTIKNHVNNEISYFQIRLTLASQQINISDIR